MIFGKRFPVSNFHIDEDLSFHIRGREIRINVQVLNKDSRNKFISAQGIDKDSRNDGFASHCKRRDRRNQYIISLTLLQYQSVPS